MDLEELLERKKPASITVRIIADSALADAVVAARRRIRDLRENKVPTAAELEQAGQELDDAEAAAQEAIVEFRFEAIEPDLYEEIQDANPSTKAQRDKVKKRARDHDMPNVPLPWDPDKFPVALIAACCVEPPLTVEQADKLWRSPQFAAERGELFQAALDVNSTTKLLDGLGNG